MLSAVGYVARDGRSEFLTEGCDLLAQYLKQHPHDADAWNIRLLHSVGPDVQTGIYPFQLNLIKTALRCCPDDPAICLWNTASRLERRRQAEQSRSITPLARRVFAKENQLRNLLEKRGVINQYGGWIVRYSHRAWDYYF